MLADRRKTFSNQVNLPPSFSPSKLIVAALLQCDVHGNPWPNQIAPSAATAGINPYLVAWVPVPGSACCILWGVFRYRSCTTLDLYSTHAYTPSGMHQPSLPALWSSSKTDPIHQVVPSQRLYRPWCGLPLASQPKLCLPPHQQHPSSREVEFTSLQEASASARFLPLPLFFLPFWSSFTSIARALPGPLCPSSCLQA